MLKNLRQFIQPQIAQHPAHLRNPAIILCGHERRPIVAHIHRVHRSELEDGDRPAGVTNTLLTKEDWPGTIQANGSRDDKHHW